MKSRTLSKILILLVATIFFSAVNLFAQTATTDTLDKGNIYVEGNLWTGTQSHPNGGMQVYGGRISYGFNNKLEIGVNGSFSNPNDPEYPIEVQPNFKYKFYENEKYGVKASGGAIAFLPVAKRAETDAFTMVYANVSKDVKKLRGARFTVGTYALVGRTKDFGSRKGWNFVYDQPVVKNLSFSTQWTTGKNRFGYVTPGFSFSLPKKMSLFAGYSIGNYDYDNHGPYISIGIYRF